MSPNKRAWVVSDGTLEGTKVRIDGNDVSELVSEIAITISGDCGIKAEVRMLVEMAELRLPDAIAYEICANCHGEMLRTHPGIVTPPQPIPWKHGPPETILQRIAELPSLQQVGEQRADDAGRLARDIRQLLSPTSKSVALSGDITPAWKTCEACGAAPFMAHAEGCSRIKSTVPEVPPPPAEPGCPGCGSSAFTPHADDCPEFESEEPTGILTVPETPSEEAERREAFGREGPCAPTIVVSTPDQADQLLGEGNALAEFLRKDAKPEQLRPHCGEHAGWRSDCDACEEACRRYPQDSPL